MEVREKLKVLRENRRLTQDDLAKELLVSKDTVSNWERFKCDIPSVYLKPLADYFELTVDYLLDDTEEVYDFREPVFVDNYFPTLESAKYDTDPKVYDAGLKGGALLYRCRNKGGDDYSCIIYRHREIYSCPRKQEEEMIKYWNCKHKIN